MKIFNKKVLIISVVVIAIITVAIASFVFWRNGKVQAANELKNDCMSKAVFRTVEYNKENKDVSDDRLKFTYQTLYNLCLLDNGVKEADLSNWKLAEMGSE
jgi:hypothetical protein